MTVIAACVLAVASCGGKKEKSQISEKSSFEEKAAYSVGASVGSYLRRIEDQQKEFVAPFDNKLVIKGFTDANGTYQPSCFYEAFTKGGLFMLDEMDASSPEALVMLNAAIANRYFDFPAPIGRKDAHPDFRVIAARNTEGFGADDQYTGRQRIDQSTIDRFISIDMDYDPRIDRAAATDRDGKTDEQLVTFATALRKAVAKTGIRISIGTRSIAQAVACSFMDRKDAIKACFLKGVSRDDRDILRKRLSDDESLDGNEWALAFQGMRD